MAKITFLYPNGDKKEIEAENGLSLMEIARASDIEEIEGACGGCMACATCHMYIHPDYWSKCLPDEGARTDEEEDMLDLAFDITDLSRLGCQIMMSDELDGMTIALPGADISNWLK